MQDLRETGNAEPCHQTAKLRRMLEEVAAQARADVGNVDEPKAQALFETTAEVLRGLVTAFEHYDRAIEPAWRR